LGDSYVISGLVKKRARLSGDLEQLRQQMIQLKGEIHTLDSAILLFDPEYKVKDIKPVRKRAANRFFESGERGRAIVDTLRESPEPLSIPEIADVLCDKRGLNLQDGDRSKLVATLQDGVRSVLAKNYIEEVSRADGTPRYSISLQQV